MSQSDSLSTKRPSNTSCPEFSLDLDALSSSLVLFGVTGDLSRKKLLPSLYDLHNRGLLPQSFCLIGYGRRSWSDTDFVEFVEKQIRAHSRTGFSQSAWDSLSKRCFFVEGTFDDRRAFCRLSQKLDELADHFKTKDNRVFYLSIPPQAFPEVCSHLSETGLVTSSEAPKGDTAGVDAPSARAGWRRVIIEKPFGHDLESAKELNSLVLSVFEPSSVFRIDHYLGKETVQNLMVLRFANQIFEPLWCSDYIDHVQITMAEDFGIGSRAGYYDGIGAARDVIQNHLLQLLALIAMEPPKSLEAQDIAQEKLSVLKATEVAEPFAHSCARGRYAANTSSEGVAALKDSQEGTNSKTECTNCSYLDEPGISKNSTTETYAALKLFVHTPRWKDTPFYVRTGKYLPRRTTEIVLVFKRQPRGLFPQSGNSAIAQNELILHIQPKEGTTFMTNAKVPGNQVCIKDVQMDFDYGTSFEEGSPGAYERLILDVLQGYPPLFPTSQEIEASWEILDPVEDFWEKSGAPEDYPIGSSGPASAEKLMSQDGRKWRAL